MAIRAQDLEPFDNSQEERHFRGTLVHPPEIKLEDHFPIAVEGPAQPVNLFDNKLFGRRNMPGLTYDQMQARMLQEYLVKVYD